MHLPDPFLLRAALASIHLPHPSHQLLMFKASSYVPTKRGTKRKGQVHDADLEESSKRHRSQARVAEVSGNGRRRLNMPSSPQKRRQDNKKKRPAVTGGWNPSWSYDIADISALDEAAAEYSIVNPALVVGKKRYNSDNPFQNWIPHRQSFLIENIRREGRGEDADLTECPTCKSSGAPSYRCVECFHSVLECEGCILSRHKRLPFHSIQRWTGTHFVKISLRDMGLRVQLGHTDLDCVNPERGAKIFTVIHTNGVHHVNLDFCGCDRKVPHRIQLLRARWYPATVDYPESAATLEVLEFFQHLTLTGKATHWQFYRTLEHMTDNTGVDVPKSRYSSFVRMSREYSSECMFKWAGKGNEKDGVANTKDGDLAMSCVACPDSDVNLPKGWETSDKQFLYRPLFSLDANFRLKNRLKSSEDKDPGLHTGKAYFVEQRGYNSHLTKYGAQKELSNCSGFRAMASAETKFTAGLRYTGVGMCVCARHELIRANGVGDLQKGEKYCNMDYVLLSAIAGLAAIQLFVIYDIACQYKVNFATRMAAFPQHMHIPPNTKIDWGIPKCHCPAHKLDCQVPHSMNLKPGVGRTDGEGIERDWAILNSVANSTKEMGPGARHDTLDLHFSHHNWRKTTAFGHTLRRKLCLASAESQRQAGLYNELVETLPLPSLEATWTSQVKAWEADSTKENPYLLQPPADRPTLHQIKRELLEQERESESAASRTSPHKKSATGFLSDAIVLEDLQRKVRRDMKATDLTPAQASRIEERRIQVQKRVRAFRNVQRAFFPTIDDVISEHTNTHQGEKVLIEDMPLWLPSALEESERELCYADGLASKEALLREAQCHDVLEKIRALQRTKLHYVHFKNTHIRGQTKSTRARSALEAIDEKIRLHRDRYNDARLALLALRGPGPWTNTLRPLAQEDLVAPSAFNTESLTDVIGVDGKLKSLRTLKDMANGLGRGYQRLSWIWMMPGVLGDGDDEDLNLLLRVEWAKARARKLRWAEEVELLKEEMRRVRQTLLWKSQRWMDRAAGWDGLSVEDKEGVAAYAHRQAQVYSSLRQHFSSLWEAPVRKPKQNPLFGERAALVSQITTNAASGSAAATSNASDAAATTHGAHRQDYAIPAFNGTAANTSETAVITTRDAERVHEEEEQWLDPSVDELPDHSDSEDDGDDGYASPDDEAAGDE